MPKGRWVGDRLEDQMLDVRRVGDRRSSHERTRARDDVLPEDGMAERSPGQDTRTRSSAGGRGGRPGCAPPRKSESECEGGEPDDRGETQAPDECPRWRGTEAARPGCCSSRGRPSAISRHRSPVGDRDEHARLLFVAGIRSRIRRSSTRRVARPNTRRIEVLLDPDRLDPRDGNHGSARLEQPSRDDQPVVLGARP